MNERNKNNFLVSIFSLEFRSEDHSSNTSEQDGRNYPPVLPECSFLLGLELFKVVLLLGGHVNVKVPLEEIVHVLFEVLVLANQLRELAIVHIHVNVDTKVSKCVSVKNRGNLVPRKVLLLSQPLRKNFIVFFHLIVNLKKVFQSIKLGISRKSFSHQFQRLFSERNRTLSCIAVYLVQPDSQEKERSGYRRSW